MSLQLVILLLCHLAQFGQSIEVVIVPKEKSQSIPPIYYSDEVLFVSGLDWKCESNQKLSDVLPVVGENFLVAKLLKCLQGHSPSRCTAGVALPNVFIYIFEGNGTLALTPVNYSASNLNESRVFIFVEVPYLCQSLSAPDTISLDRVTLLNDAFTLRSVFPRVALHLEVSDGTLLINDERFAEEGATIDIELPTESMQDALSSLIYIPPADSTIDSVFILTAGLAEPGKQPHVITTSRLVWYTPPESDDSSIPIMTVSGEQNFTGVANITVSVLNVPSGTIIGGNLTVGKTLSAKGASFVNTAITVAPGATATLSGLKLDSKSVIVCASGATCLIPDLATWSGSGKLQGDGTIVINTGSLNDISLIIYSTVDPAPNTSPIITEMQTIMSGASGSAITLTQQAITIEDTGLWALRLQKAGDSTPITNNIAGIVARFQASTTLQTLNIAKDYGINYGKPFRLNTGLNLGKSSVIDVRDYTALTLGGQQQVIQGRINLGINSLKIAPSVSPVGRKWQQTAATPATTLTGIVHGDPGATISISAPTLLINAIFDVPVRVTQSGSLQGSGQIPSLEVDGSVIVGPSNSLLVTGTAQFNSNARLVVSFATTSYGQLIVQGGLTVATGATLGFDNSVAYVTARDTLTFVTAQSITGQFIASPLALNGIGFVPVTSSALSIYTVVPNPAPPSVPTAPTPPNVPAIAPASPETTATALKNGSSSNNNTLWVIPVALGIGALLLFGIFLGVFLVHKRSASPQPASYDLPQDYEDSKDIAIPVPQPTPSF